MEKNDDLKQLGTTIKETLIVIIKTLDQTNVGDPIEKAIRLVSVKLQAVLALMRDERSLSGDFLSSPIIERTMNAEISGGCCLERVKQNKLTDGVFPMREFDDAIAIMTIVHRITKQ